MARSGINKAIVLGNLGNDPETKYLPNGNAVTNISVATSESWKDKQSGQTQERTEWQRIVFFNRLAEIAGEYLRKGSKVYVEGSLRTRKWQDQNGNDRYSTEIVASDMQMLSGRGEQGGSPGGGGFDSYNQMPEAQGGQGGMAGGAPAGGFNQQQPAQSPAPAPSPAAAEFEDDIPF